MGRVVVFLESNGATSSRKELRSSLQVPTPRGRKCQLFVGAPARRSSDCDAKQPTKPMLAARSRLLLPLGAHPTPELKE